MNSLDLINNELAASTFTQVVFVNFFFLLRLGAIPKVLIEELKS